jgi:hypothetical protein
MNACSLASTGARDSSLFSPAFPFSSLREEEGGAIAIDEGEQEEDEPPSDRPAAYSPSELSGLLNNNSSSNGNNHNNREDSAAIVTTDTRVATSDESAFSPAASDAFGISVSPPSAPGSDETAAAAATAAACASISAAAAAQNSTGAVHPEDVDSHGLGAGICEVSDDSLLDAFFDLEVMPATRSRSVAHTISGTDARHNRPSAAHCLDSRASSRTTVTLQ